MRQKYRHGAKIALPPSTGLIVISVIGRIEMLGVTLAASDYLERLERELSLLDASALQSWADLIYQAWQHDRFVFVFGNGGSATTATHIS